MECIILSPPLQKEKGQAVKLKNYHIAFGIWEGELYKLIQFILVYYQNIH